MISKNYKRKKGDKPQGKRILIIAEGEVTEREYINRIRGMYRSRSARLSYKGPGPTSPLEIVNKAIQEMRAERRKDPYDEVWCVFDADCCNDNGGANALAQAATAAEKENIFIAFSNPCFELWMVLHCEDVVNETSANQIQQKCSQLGLIKNKHLCNENILLENYDQARQRAEKLAANHKNQGHAALHQQNPSSNVYELVESIRKAFS